MCLLHVIKKLKADRIWGSIINTEGTHPANSRQIKQDYASMGIGVEVLRCSGLGLCANSCSGS
jgi:hypothetical protein